MIIALASPRVATSLDEAIATVERFIADAARRGAMVVCFPEAYVPGLRGQEFEVFPYGHREQEATLLAVARAARLHRIGVILGTEIVTERGRHIAATVIDRDGTVVGTQTKNQLDPSEDAEYVPGDTRRVFEIDGLRFGVTICHEGWRYPETVRWAAVRGAKIVFHQHFSGSDREGVRLTGWGSPDAPYYEKAMMCRSIENTIYFASVNYAMRYQDSATTLIDPSGAYIAHLPYGEEGLLVHDIDPERATGLLAGRFAPDRYRE